MIETPTALPEHLPTLYRSILTLVGELERCDERAEAGRIRTQALAAYASAWDDRNRRRLTQLLHQLHHSIALHGQSAGRRVQLP